MSLSSFQLRIFGSFATAFDTPVIYTKIGPNNESYSKMSYLKIEPK